VSQDLSGYDRFGVDLMMSFWFLLLSVCLLLLTGSVGTLCFRNVRSKAKWLASAGASGSIVGLVLLGLPFDTGDHQMARKLGPLMEEICPSAERTGTIKLSSSAPSRPGLTELVVEEAPLGQRVETAGTEEVEARIRAELAKAEEVEARERAKRAREDEEEAHRRAEIAS
jgi:hypothetical protein